MKVPGVDDRFYAHMTAEDEMGVVIRAHIHIEASVIDFINAKVVAPDALPRMQYEARLRLAKALGLDGKLFDVLKALGDLRNSYSHKLDAKLTSAKVDELFSVLPKDNRLQA